MQRVVIPKLSGGPSAAQGPSLLLARQRRSDLRDAALRLESRLAEPCIPMAYQGGGNMVRRALPVCLVSTTKRNLIHVFCATKVGSLLECHEIS